MNHNTSSYQEYAQVRFQNLANIQEIFKLKYEIDNFDYWNYTQASEVLHLYSDDKELFFKYIPVGTFCTKSNTWLWAWANLHSVEPRKSKTLDIKKFGKEREFESLYTPKFEGNKYTGWEMAATAFDILEGIGTYRVESDDLEKYFLITKEISKEEAKELEKNLVECETHGTMRSAFVCQHLINAKTQVGFEEAFDTYQGMILEEDDDLQAWCYTCEKERLKTKGWTEESMSFADIKVVCEGCYYTIKESQLNT